ncbi:hypothetical protein MMC25_004680 [Agyrium rufum]|nr:hypothetical protein [Agyrium rufum]
MSADFWAGYLSGAAGIIIGNPLDLVKVRLQAGERNPSAATIDTISRFSDKLKSLLRGSPAPILTYGVLNALLFVSYNRSLHWLNGDQALPEARTQLLNVWTAGALGGLATWIVSAPTELVKCRAQLDAERRSSWIVTREIWRERGLTGFYFGGGITSVRDAVGYGFYFWSYKAGTEYVTGLTGATEQSAANTLICGGIAGVITWASIFPLDAIKTRLQTQCGFLTATAAEPLMAADSIGGDNRRLKGSGTISREMYQEGGMRIFFRGLGVCSVRAFIVNAVQWAVYEWTIKALTTV